ncbi:protein of unknown function (plasmid) [Vibrio harveyi]|nr:protein of unknown function [Vibrio harveyi]
MQGRLRAVSLEQQAAKGYSPLVKPERWREYGQLSGSGK